MKRAREDHARLTLDQAADAISVYMPTSGPTISRLESLPGPPADKRRRMLACLLAVTYGLDPIQFGVNATDLPRALSDQVISPIRWSRTSRHAAVQPRRAA